MPPIVAFGAAIVGTGILGVGVFSTATLFVIGATATALLVGAGALAFKAMIPKINYDQPDNDKSRQTTVRSTIEPQKIIYGETLVSGPITFVGVSGPQNRVMHHVIALAGHEVNAITDIWLDDQIIQNSTINGFGNVTSGTFADIVRITKYLGTETQAADPTLRTEFPLGYTTAHQGKGIAYIHTEFTLTDDSQEVWDKYSPSNIKAVVQGRKIYDPRLDLFPGGPSANPASIVYSSNPALTVADYLMNARFGMGINQAKIDWDAVEIAANACDVLVDVPGGQEKRFTANGVLFAADNHNASISKLLSAMNGKLIYSSGTYYIKAGIFEEATETLNETDLSGSITVKTSVERSERFNTVGGLFIDPQQLYKSSEFPKVTITSAFLRDNSEVLEQEIELPFTNSSYMAQRLAHKMIQMSDQQKIVNFPANLAGLRVAVGDRVTLSIEELNWSNKVFQCLGWSFNNGGDDGVMLTLQEDDAGSYDDMLPVDYSTVSADGVITEGFPGVPDPQNLTATSGLRSIDLNWLNPVNTNKFKEIAIYASPDSSWANKVEIGRTMGTQFFHDASNTIDPIIAGDTRYYWIRALQYGTGTDSTSLSDRNPDNDTSTISATVGTITADSVEWENVADSTDNKPDNTAFGVKVDGNDRITGFGLNSTPATAAPFSEFYIIADKFAVVNPASTADTPIVPFEVASGLITMGTDVRINGDLVTTGTIDAARIDVAGVITAGSIVIGSDIENFIIGSEVNANVTSISGSAITTGTIDAARIDVAGVITAGSIVIGTDIENFIEGSEVNANVTSISGSVITTGTIIADKIVLDGTTLAASGDFLGIKDGGVNTTQITANAVSKFSSTTTVATGPVFLNVEYVILTDTITTNGGEVVAWADLQFERFVTSRAGVFRLYIGATLVAQRSLLSTKDQVTIMGRRTAFAAGTYEVKLAVLLTAGSMGDIDDGTLISMESKR